MSDNAPAVALLFDDVELGAQLRVALCERGARIVHEGGVASMNRERLQEVAADVIVVNLDDDAEEAFEPFYLLLDGDRPRVVFNDAQASRALAGWDRDRWARHLAVKVLQQGDVDPPRPEDARGLDDTSQIGAGPAVNQNHGDNAVGTDGQSGPPIDEITDAAAAKADTDPVDADAAFERMQRINDESESLAAELETLLASADVGDALEPLPEPTFAPAETQATEAWLDELLNDDDANPTTAAFRKFNPPESDAGSGAAINVPATGLDDLLARGVTRSEADDCVADPPGSAAVNAPANWALLDDNAPASAILPRDPNDPANFGVEKLSAADYLAPDVEVVARGYEPVMNLELVSMEEAIAPQAIGPAHEMHLDELHMALSRLVLTGAAVGGSDAAAAFYAALPISTRLSFLHTQHLGGRDATALVANLASDCALPIKLAESGDVLRQGEVLVVPTAQQVRVHRDGRIELTPAADETGEPSIDDSFTTAAESFGRDTIAIVFSGRSVDAVAGAQAIHDRGGSVWVEAVDSDLSDMVNGISAEHLANYSGTPQALAAHLIEVYS